MSSAQEKDRKGKYYAEQVRVVGCTRYQPCPICYKCMVKASHLFIKCQNCQIPICGHNERARNFMIRRENYREKLMHFFPSADKRFKKYAEEKRAD